MKMIAWKPADGRITKILSGVVVVGSLLLSACATPPLAGQQSLPVPEARWTGALPDVAAEYASTLVLREAPHPDHHAEENSSAGQASHADEHSVTTTVRLWRKPDLVIREEVETGIADYWQQDHHTIIQKKFFHNERRGVEFQQADLQMLNKLPQWQPLACLLDTAVISQLTEVDTGWSEGVPVRRYEGRLNDTQWRIDVRTDLMVPVRIERENAERHETLALVNAWPLSESPRQPVAVDQYNVIDFADIGDMEYDPFVKQVEAMLGGVHHH